MLTGGEQMHTGRMSQNRVLGAAAALAVEQSLRPSAVARIRQLHGEQPAHEVILARLASEDSGYAATWWAASGRNLAFAIEDLTGLEEQMAVALVAASLAAGMILGDTAPSVVQATAERAAAWHRGREYASTPAAAASRG